MRPHEVQRFEQVFGIDKRRRDRRSAHRLRADHLARIHLTDPAEVPSKLSVAEITEILRAEFKLTGRKAYAASYKAVAEVLEQTEKKSVWMRVRK